MNGRNRFVEAIATLIQQTQDGELTWEACTPGRDLTTQADTIADTVYMTKKDCWHIRLYPYKQKVWPEEDIWYWDERVALEVSDERESCWWRFPHEGAIWDLIDAVKFKVAGVGQFIDKLLPK